MWEVICADTFTTSYVSLALTGAGLVANQGKKEKAKVQSPGSKYVATHSSQLQWRPLGSLGGGSHACLQGSWTPNQIDIK